MNIKVETPAVAEYSDTVIVIDRSRSMNSTLFGNAKTAAVAIASQLLAAGNTYNRVAVVSFAANANNETGNNFSTNLTAVTGAINRLNRSNYSGSTGGAIQAGLHNAEVLLNNSTADHKNIILLSDGEAGYSYRINNAINNVSSYMTEQEDGTFQTNQNVPQTAYNYNSIVGDGTSSTTEFAGFFDGCRPGVNCSIYYYNHVNSTIAEAGFLNGVVNLYVMPFTTSTTTTGATTLSSMVTAAGGASYGHTDDDISGIIDEVSGGLVPMIGEATVEDAMDYATMSTRANTLSRPLDFTLDNGKFVAVTSYNVAINDSILTGTPDADGYYPLTEDGNTVLKYGTNSTASFLEPRVKPFIVNVEKELILKDETGTETTKDGVEFRFKISGNNTVYSVTSGGKTSVVMPIEIGTSYTVTEEAWVPSNSDVEFENYVVTYTDGTFAIAATHGDETTVKIKNTYETTSVEASRVWDDEDDRDGIRSSYEGLYIAVKDGSEFVGYQATPDANGKFIISGLPKYRNGTPISYTVVEVSECSTAAGVISCTPFTDDGKYASSVSDTVVTNKHIPATIDLLVKKTWVGNTNLPKSITVNVSGGDYNEDITISKDDKVDGECTGWCKKVAGLYQYYQGAEVEYTVKEKSLAWTNNEGFIEYGTDTTDDGDESVEGRWDASESNNSGTWTITNAWTSAEFIYDGSTDFKIKKIDKDGQPMTGVTFSVNGDEMVTDDEGVIVVEIPVNLLVREEEKNYEIYEIDTLEGYDLDSDTATLKVVIESNLTSVDKTSLVNNYTKKFTFTASGNENYVWDKDERMFVLKNNRSEAESLTIEEVFDGVDEETFKASGIKFVVSGPDDFKEKTIDISEFAFEDGKATFELENLPTGDYTVVKEGGEIEGYTLKIEGETEITKKMAKDDTKKMTFTNVYEKDEEPEEEPEDEPEEEPEDEPEITEEPSEDVDAPLTPNTGEFAVSFTPQNADQKVSSEATIVNYLLGASMLVVFCLPMVFAAKRKEK